MVEDVLLIVQARYGSTRLPGKVLKKIKDKTILEIGLTRLSESKTIDKIVVATTVERQDEVILDEVNRLGYSCFRGSESNVLERYYLAAKEYSPKWVVRVTSDCPLIDAELVDEVVNYAKNNKVDYCSNILIENYPDGQDVEVFTFESLKKACDCGILESEKEHVTPYIRNNSTFNGRKEFKALNYSNHEGYAEVRMTVDEPSDFEMLTQLINVLGVDKSWKEYADYMIKHRLTDINSSIIRNEGYLKSISKDKKDE